MEGQNDFGMKRAYAHTAFTLKIPKPIKFKHFLRSDLLNQKTTTEKNNSHAHTLKPAKVRVKKFCSLCNNQLCACVCVYVSNLKTKATRKISFAINLVQIYYMHQNTRTKKPYFIQFKTNFFPQKQNFKLKQKTKRMKQLLLDLLFYTILFSFNFASCWLIVDSIIYFTFFLSFFPNHFL